MKTPIQDHMKRSFFLLAVLAAFVIACNDPAQGGRGKPRHDDQASLPDPQAKPPPPETPGPGLTFLVAADTHFGYEGMEELNRIQVEAMNSLPGTPYPDALGGTAGTPLGVLAAGDLTENGRLVELKLFVKYFGMKGVGGMLKYPVYPGTGNHDRRGGRTAVAKKIKYHYKTLPYSWNWQDVHFICLDDYPRAEYRKWLKKDLAGAGKERPLVIFFHYCILGPYSDWWSEKKKKQFRSAIKDFNVIAIFHGHYHAEDYYQWEGYDVFNVGSPKYIYPSFAAVRVTKKRMDTAYWNYVQRQWSWWHRKELAW
jgi:cytolysin (calcineurin-like family phosphatase)